MMASDALALLLGLVGVLLGLVLLGPLVRAEVGSEVLRRRAVLAEVRQRAERGEQ